MQKKKTFNFNAQICIKIVFSCVTFCDHVVILTDDKLLFTAIVKKNSNGDFDGRSFHLKNEFKNYFLKKNVKKNL